MGKFCSFPLYEQHIHAYLIKSSMAENDNCFLPNSIHYHGGALVSTGMLEAMVAGRGAAGLVKSGNKVIANNDYEYAYAA